MITDRTVNENSVSLFKRKKRGLTLINAPTSTDPWHQITGRLIDDPFSADHGVKRYLS